MMFCDTGPAQRLRAWTFSRQGAKMGRPTTARAARGPAEPDILDRRRRELAALLEEIRDLSPGPAAIIQAVREATEGKLPREGLGRIEARIAALYEAG